MYQIILLDDEPWALLGVQRIFPWEQYGFSICGSFSNAFDALDFLKEHPVDFILSDIRMPGMDGIDFMEEVKQLHPDTVFAFVSGYADFSYAQQALRKGAYDYLLKPVSPEDAQAFTIRLADYLHSIMITKDLSAYHEMQRHSIVPGDIFPDFDQKDGYHIQGILLLCPDLDHPPLSFSDTYPHRILNLGLGKFFYLVASPSDLCSMIEEQLPLFPANCQIGISSFQFSNDNTMHIVSQAEQSLISLKFHNRFGIFQYVPFSKSNLKNITETLIRSVQNKDFTKCRHLLSDAVSQGIQPEDAIVIWNQLLLYADPSASLNWEYGYLNIAKLDQQFRNYTDLWDSLLDILQNDQTAVLPTVHNQLYENMVSYIRQHFTEDLYLKDISDSLFINFSYACELFKKYSGTTFSKYLTNLRMEQATQLLLSTDLTIEEICYQVGYNNYSYFNRVFKKIYDITPFQYRITHKK